MKKLFIGMVLSTLLLGITGCQDTEENYQKEIIEAWTQTNEYDSASYSYSNSYTNAEGLSVANSVEGAYNKEEDTWSQISSYGTQGKGKQEEVFSPDGIYVRYDLDGEGWKDWGTLQAELPEYATYLKNLFEQEISFENFESIEKKEKEEEYVYTLTYEESYMQEQVNEDLEAAEAYLEVLKSSTDSEENIKAMEQKIENLKMMAGAMGQVIYYVDKAGNLTGIGSQMVMENGGGTSALLRLSELGKVSFEGYTDTP